MIQTDLGELLAPPASPVTALVDDVHRLVERAWRARVIGPHALVLWALWAATRPLRPEGHTMAVLAHTNAVHWRDSWAGKAKGAQVLLARACEEACLSAWEGGPRLGAAGVVEDARRELEAEVARRARA